MAKKRTAEEEALFRLETVLANSTEGTGTIGSTELAIFLCDCSGSMDDELQKGVTKMQAQKAALNEFLRLKIEWQTNHADAGDTVAVVAFPSLSDSFDAEVLLSPTVPLPQNELVVHKLRASGGTPLHSAITSAGKIVKATPFGLIRLVIISDGVPDDQQMALNLAQTLADEFGIIIDTVGVGRAGHTVGYDEAFLRRLAEIGGGTFYSVNDVASFTKVIREAEAERRALLGGGLRLLGAIGG